MEIVGVNRYLESYMAFYVPFVATNVADADSVSEGIGGASGCRCTEYRARVRRLRRAAGCQVMQRVERAIAHHEAEVRAVLEGALEALVREGAVAIVERVFDSVPEVVARGLAERAAEVASTVLRGERGIIAVAHPLDYAVMAQFLGASSMWQWQENDQCPRGEIHLQLSAGRITIRWRELLREIIGRGADDDV